MTTKEYVEITQRISSATDEEKHGVIQYNKDLIQEYSFLKPDDEYCGYEDPSKYDYSWTLMDDMPPGRRISFGDELLKDLKEELIRQDFLEDYRIFQIKEKFGGLRWYDNLGGRWIKEILPKYEKLADVTCIECGKPAKWMSQGWISPYCDTCKETFSKTTRFVELESD